MAAFECPIKMLDDYLDSIADVRSKASCPYWQTVWFLLGLLSAYLFFTLWLGPRFLKNRAPYSLKNTLVGYNLLQVVTNAYFVYKVCVYYLSHDVNLWCEPVLYNRTDEVALKAYNITYFYFSLKVLDLMDTVFFVLRKKTNQVTFLHVSHHVAMILIAWTAVRIYPGGTGVLGIAINGVVHFVMYGYYLLAAIELPFANVIKQYITTLQLVQFVFNISYLVLSVTFGRCNNPVGFLWTGIILDVFLFSLFMRFYFKTYKSGESRGQKKNKMK